MPPKRACDICYRRKIQCLIPAEGPPCDWCSHHSSECSFNREAPRKRQRRKVTASDVQCLNKRIQQLEDALAQANARRDVHGESSSDHAPADSVDEPNTAAVRSSPVADSVSRLSTEHFYSPHPYSRTSEAISGIAASASRVLQPGSHIGPNWFFRGIHAFSDEGRLWISSKTGQTVDWTKLHIFTAKPSPLATLPSPSSPEICELPDRDACQLSVAFFFQSSFQLNFPVIDPVLFDQTISLAYEETDDARTLSARLSARACVFAVLGIIAFIPGASFLTQSDSYTHKSRCILSRITQDASLTTLQAVIMLHVQHLLSGRWQEADSLLSVASQLVYTLGGHIYDGQRVSSDDHSLPSRETRHLRNLFWLCYISDKDLSLRTGRPPLLSDTYCDLTLVDDYPSSYTHLRGLDGYLHSSGTRMANLKPHFWGDARLGFLKEKIYRLLYSVHAMSDKDNRLLVHIRQLDDEIECWRLSVPVDFRPALSVSPETLIATPDTRTPHRTRYFHLLLEYWYLMIFVHTTVRRYDAHTVIGDGSHDLHSVIHSSYDLSLEAGRSTLRCLRVFIKTLSDEDLWFLIFYTTNASISLFLNMIIHPEEADGQLDLELLISTANTIRIMKPRAAVPGEGTRIQQHSEFIMWLVWLGSCAITKRRDMGL
ncbi:fungal-specific transcription factor domain-containing protein [Colletotrichum navitas]|uniref:Fungal-specific transcription factor domain-containing protein n=1 Tax=Colletotrichum navitas TaxID=681940 RepID=A0AAD8PSF7_9PEZI|nr:fungal-specific transcription factor domain-containing protein [Colletotrichum navitas]KAK1579345.1 fungal-specific transcription factor domain-containing protein [Colletotrichum navitas]